MGRGGRAKAQGSQVLPTFPLPPVPVANKRDTRSIEEAMNEIRAKKRLRQSGEELPPTS